ncbi:Breast cancer type 2 susceptibility protein-like [Stylophora pistillata]|uniref:Breast cancer type 2 susceptibility protein-like n=1 Tax=Stylophora pistillata TaxID=50429 RepID=A0A2B4S5I5_STYPI|nr:Breast cancer type 2 susceptibility protein-like [Stylophora pistillata]
MIPKNCLPLLYEFNRIKKFISQWLVLFIGSSLSVSLNAQSQNIDDELIKSTVSQPTDCIQETAQIPRNGTTLQTLVGKNDIMISSAPAGESLHGRSNYLRKRSFGKVSGIRRSARTKRFSYPSASQVGEHHIGKSIKRTFTNDDVSLTAKKENPSIREGKGSVNCERYDDSALCATLNSRDNDIEMPLSKRLKFEGLSASCKSENNLNPSSIVNSKEKDVFLYDMDALTQFPMEYICSSPPGASRPRQEKKEDVTESVKPGELLFFDGSKEPSSRCTEEEELQPVYGNTREISDVSHSRAVASLDDGKYPSLADEIVGDDDQVWENNLIEAGKLTITALHEPQSRGLEPTQADNCQYFERFSPKKTGVYVSSEDKNIKSFVTDGTGFTGFKTASGKHVSVTLEAMGKAKAAIKKIEDSLGLCEGESKQVLRHLQPEVSTSCNATQNNGLAPNLNDVSLKKRVGETSDENLTGFERVQSSVLPGFCAFSTASGNQIHISQSAMRSARKTLSEVDNDMKASRIVHDKGVEKAKEDPCFSMEREKTCSETNRIAAFSSVVAKEPASGNDDPDSALAAYIPVEGKQRESAPLEDHLKKKSSTARAGETENKDITLQSPTHVVGGSLNNNGENVHDSLLEDLLNDFKCKRRDSLIAISEESDKVEEPDINTTSAVNSSWELRHKLCNDEYSSECNGNVLTEILPDDAGKNTAWRTSIKVASISTSEETTALSTTMQSGEKIVPPISFSGFQTASGQQVKLSAESMEKGAAIMQEIDNSILHNKDTTASPTTFPGFQTASGKLVKLSAESMEKGAAIMQNIDNSLQRNRDTTQTSSTFSGFQTASGQNVELSKRSLEKGAAIMQEIDNTIQLNRDATTPSKAFSGFQTASGKLVKLSAKSMERGAAIMQNIDNSLQCNRDITQTSSTFSGFQTASGQKVKLSKRSTEKGSAIMQEIDNSIQHNRDTTATPKFFSGFQTAYGQLVKLSTGSMEKGTAIMLKIDNSLQQKRETAAPPNAFSGFQTANGQQVTLSEESMKKGAAIMPKIDNSIQQCKEISAPSTGFSGFQTASGQKVKISAESMEKGTAIMQKIDNFLQQSRETNVPPNAFSGFQTASGQKFKLSEGSVEKGATTVQQNHDSLQQNKDISAPSTGFSGFQTASGQKVKLSAESMKKGTAIMQEIDNFLHRNKVSTLSETASGQKVNFEKQSIERGMAIMRQIDKSIEQNKGSSSLENGAAYLQNADQSFQKNVDGNEPTNCSSENGANVTSAFFSGFQTANGKTIQISESALEKAKDTMASIENDIQKSRSGTERILDDSLFKRVNGWKPVDQDTDTLINDCHVVTAVVPGRSMPLHDGRCSVEHDDAVSREILESSEALLAYESSLDVSEYDKASVAWDSLSKSAVSMTGSAKGLSHCCKEDPQRRHSTPVRCGEDMLNRTHRDTRSGMKPCSTTPSGVFHDRRVHFRAPLRARLATVENTCRSRGSDSTRSLNPLRATTPGCFKTKHSPSPRTSTPLNANAKHWTSVPRPLFITPYRNRELSTVVSPLARCSSSSFPVSESPKPLVTDLMVPSAKKAKVSSPNWSSKMKCDQLDILSKCNERVKPLPGFLSGLRRHNQRIKLKDYVGIGTLPGRHTPVELLQLGLSPEVISVTSSNAVSFRLCGRRYLSETALSRGEGVRTEDGGLLHIGSDGCIGLEEIRRYLDLQNKKSAFLTTPGVDSQLISEEWIANHYRWLVWKLAAMEVAFPCHFAGRCLTPDWLLCQLKYRYDKEFDSSDRSALKKIMERDDVSSRTMVLCVSSVTVTEDDTEKEAVEHNDNQGDIDGQSRMKMASCAIIEVTDGWYSIRAILDRPLTKLLHYRKIFAGQKLILCGAELVGSEQAVSPLEWMEKMPDGTNVFRNSRHEEREVKKFETDRHQRREKLFLKIQEEFEKECFEPERERRRSARFRRRSFVPSDLKDLHDGKEIYEALSQATDPDAIKGCLDERQLRALEEYQRLSQERKFAELQSKFESTWREQEEECQPQRNVVPLLKVRVADYLLRGRDRQNAVLSIWRPSEEVMQLLSEGSRLRIYHLTASGVRSNVQTVYLSDEWSNIVAIKFWGGLKSVAVEDVVKAGNFICCSNLTVRQDDRLQCPFLTFWELSNVSLKPREPHLRNALKTLQQSIQDLRLFMSQIQEKLDIILYPNRASLPENLKVDAEALHSTGKEIGPSLLSRPSSCIDVKVSHQSDDPSLEIPNQAAHEVNPGEKLRHSKRKLLESIPEPPPLSPLPNLIPASVRREFKKPRRAESSGNIHRKQ